MIGTRGFSIGMSISFQQNWSISIPISAGTVQTEDHAQVEY